MAVPALSLRLLDHSSATKEQDLASELFHQINRIIPQDQTLLTVPPSCRARDAVALMQQHGYSQVPIVDNGRVLGVFSFRSFAREAAGTTWAEWQRQRCAPGDLSVVESIEEFQFARVTDEPGSVLDAIRRDGGVLVGRPDHLVGVLTPTDFIDYLYRVAAPFVMLSEVELAVRALIRIAMPEEEIAAAAKRCLSKVYGGAEAVPTSLEDMTFDNYHSLISNGDNWPHFEPVLDVPRTRASGKLKEITSIRNALFHFTREATPQDRRTLDGYRTWLQAKITQAEGRRRGEVRQ